MADQGSVRVTAHRRFGQFLITKPARVEIDGTPVGEAKWKQPATFPASAGVHKVVVYFPYLGKARCGEGSIDVNVGAGQTVDITYRSAWIVYSKGSLTAG